MNSFRLLIASLLGSLLLTAETPRFKVVTYNVENYLVERSGTRAPKPEAARRKVVEMLKTLRPDVLALQEIGTTNALLELQSRLRQAGVDLPHWEHVSGYDTNIFVAILSRFPITARRPHSQESFLLEGRRFRTSRGLLEVDLEAGPNYRFTLFTAHLKSKRAIGAADEAEMREQEARVLRRLVEARLAADPKANVLVCGDFNDTKDSPALKALLGRSSQRPLVDTRPVERNGDQAAPENPRWDPRHVSWTHFYGKEDSYSRIDYILLSTGMAREWRREGSFLPTVPDWGVGSDHRPVLCEFEASEQ
ncbi:MAG: endonuclease/exonuclease/phosphatase family protein [Verrucomicrobiota bacterium]